MIVTMIVKPGKVIVDVGALAPTVKLQNESPHTPTVTLGNVVLMVPVSQVILIPVNIVQAVL